VLIGARNYHNSNIVETKSGNRHDRLFFLALLAEEATVDDYFVLFHVVS
jgi:hypothetical protein